MNAPKLYLFRGAWLPAKEIAAILGVHKNTVYNRRIGDRIAEGSDLVDPFREPPDNAILVQHNGKMLSLRAWARTLGIKRETLMSRINRGASPYDAVTKPLAPYAVRRHNRRVIRRIASTFRSTDQTGGYSPTFADALGTGQGRHARDLQSEKSA